MRRLTVALMLVVVAVTAVACGGASRAASSDAASVLASIDATAPQGPQRMTADLTVDFKGTVNSVLGKVLTQPIHLTFAGVLDPDANAADMTLSAATLGHDARQVRLLTTPTNAWMQLEDAWYAPSLAQLSYLTGGLMAEITPGTIQAGWSAAFTMIGDPAKLLRDPASSREQVEGVDTDKVSGEVDVERVLEILFLTSPAGGAGPAAADLRMLQDAVKQAHLDFWVGTDDHRVHKVALTLAVALTAEQQKSTGGTIDSLDVTFEATSVASEPPTITAPESPRTGEQFEQDFFPLLNRVLGADSG